MRMEGLADQPTGRHIVIRHVMEDGQRSRIRTLSPAEAAHMVQELLTQGVTRITISAPEKKVEGEGEVT